MIETNFNSRIGLAVLHGRRAKPEQDCDLDVKKGAL
jgi:hypothetical protein